jgi:hypothetical protein
VEEESAEFVLFSSILKSSVETAFELSEILSSFSGNQN